MGGSIHRFAVRIFTGAVISVGFDTVVAQEQTQLDLSTGQLTILQGQRAGQHRRLSGDDLTVGQIGSAAYFGLSGNPFGALVTFLFDVRDALLQLAGANPKALVTVPVRCAHALR